MSRRMKAYQFLSPAKGLEFRELPVPVPGKNQVLVQIKAAGLCHTDCNIISGLDNTFFWNRPITLGHEVAGVVVQCGPGAAKYKPGDSIVAVITTKHPVEIGDVVTSPGIGCDGGFSEYVLLYEWKTLPMPEGITFAQAAVATDAVATAYHAVVTEGQISKSSKVAIIGLGGLGLSAVQIASHLGAKVYGVDVHRRKFPAALMSGAHCCGKTMDDFPGVKFDAVFDFAGVGTTTAAAAKAVKAGGKVVLVGLSKKEATLDTHSFVALGVKLVGSVGSSILEVEEAMKMVANGIIEPAIEEVSFSNLPHELKRLERGDSIGRLYTDPSKDETKLERVVRAQNVTV
ncbi:NAD-dependent alcohol dehydrogenase [Colletotrichum liriopes]|uniref:NAD-dependent alcohol dehydrogenase n=1 Tax=Colletotrichum liriopes TaxID=708192 RepID=A0AA37GZN8_9PEZI|nr:NAD-dependent alcohol dehydrogenase [Colletotrichum liriopes]